MKRISFYHKFFLLSAVATVCCCIFMTGCHKGAANSPEASEEIPTFSFEEPTQPIHLYEYVTVGETTFSVWETPERLDTLLGENFRRSISLYNGNASAGGYYYLGTDYSIAGIRRVRCRGKNGCTAFDDLAVNSSLDELLDIADVTLIPSGNTDSDNEYRYSLLIANNIAVDCSRYGEYYTAISSGMLYPNCTFSLRELNQALSPATTEKQRQFITARMALLSDVVNQRLSRLLEITFIVNDADVITGIEYTCYFSL